jgi:hypothetical protein
MRTTINRILIWVISAEEPADHQRSGAAGIKEADRLFRVCQRCAGESAGRAYGFC